MKIIKAKTAGFCFGVDRAVKLTYGLLEQGVRVATLGPLIHNPQCVADLAARGAVTVDTPEQVPDGYEVVVRSHGVPQCVYDALGARGLVVHDATCPFVAKIHRLARRAGEEGRTLLVAGDKNHPEVQGIVGHTRGSVFVFADLEELKALLTPENTRNGIFVVAQTTFEVKKWQTRIRCRAPYKGRRRGDSTGAGPRMVARRRHGGSDGGCIHALVYY